AYYNWRFTEVGFFPAGAHNCQVFIMGCQAFVITHFNHTTLMGKTGRTTGTPPKSLGSPRRLPVHSPSPVARAIHSNHESAPDVLNKNHSRKQMSDRLSTVPQTPPAAITPTPEDTVQDD